MPSTCAQPGNPAPIDSRGCLSQQLLRSLIRAQRLPMPAKHTRQEYVHGSLKPARGRVWWVWPQTPCACSHSGSRPGPVGEESHLWLARYLGSSLISRTSRIVFFVANQSVCVST